METLRTNKVDAARRQIESSIRLLFIGEDPLPLITIAGAANRILRDIAEKHDQSVMSKTMKRLIVLGMEKEFWTVISRPINYLKHADKDPDSLLTDVHVEYLEYIIFLGCAYYQDLGNMLTCEMRAFMAWFGLMHPNIVVLSQEAKALVPEVDVSWLRSLDRPKQLELGRHALAIAK